MSYEEIQAEEAEEQSAIAESEDAAGVEDGVDESAQPSEGAGEEEES
jgi:hypothetical protein